MSGTVLVTGAQGFLGRHVVAELMDSGAAVIGLGRSERLRGVFTHRLGAGGRRAPLPPALEITDAMTYVRVPLEDADATARLLRDIHPCRVIHLAGALRDESWPTLFAGNVTASVNLCRAIAAMADPPSLLIGSSGSVYGCQTVMPVSERALPDPVGPYAATKLMAEIAARAILERGAPLAIARIFNLLGPGLQRRHLAADLAHTIAAIESGRAPPVLRLGSLTSVRDFIDVRDCARALAAWPDRLARATANLGSGQGTPVADLVSRFVRMSRREIAVTNEAERERPGADVMIADMTQGAAAGAATPLERSITDMLAYAREAR